LYLLFHYISSTVVLGLEGNILNNTIHVRRIYKILLFVSLSKILIVP